MWKKDTYVILKEYIPFLEEKSLQASRWRGMKFAFCTRFIFFFTMIISSAIIPTFDAGDDVLKFDLRFDNIDVNSDLNWDFFCMKGHACEMVHPSSITNIEDRLNPEVYEILKLTNKNEKKKWQYRITFYRYILSPFINWDAARFLTLAVDPKARYPSLDDVCEVGHETTKLASEVSRGKRDTHFAPSEQSHAFFPLLPIIIRYIALILTQLMPIGIRPPTFEATVVLSCLLWNTVSFIIAALALQQLTQTLIANDNHKFIKNETMTEKNKEGHALEIANTTLVLFCLNPASVFFVTCYSEATFSAFTFLGYSLFARSLYSTSNSEKCTLTCCSTCCWMLASYTRSNGSLMSIFLFIHACGILARYCKVQNIWNTRRSVPGIFQDCLLVICYMISIVCVVIPVIFHDQKGKQVHCNKTNTYQQPQWCSFAKDETVHGRFSLYAYVQRKHWNVGFLRYYEPKQIPNFLLAFPILWIGVTAAASWIQKSWLCFMEAHNVKRPFSLRTLWNWAIFALSDIWPSERTGSEMNTNTNDESTSSTINPKMECHVFASNMLAYYAMLSGFVFIGITVAHVQISTRMICSASPAIYWYMSSLMMDPSKTLQRCYLVCYLGLFHVLGILLHVNRLPWT